MELGDQHSGFDDGLRQPPGTVELLAHGREKKEDGSLVLIPAPSGDANDPLGWPAWRKTVHFAQLVGMTMAIFTGLSIQTIFWPQMLEDMKGVTQQHLANAQAVQLVGLGVGCVFFIPFANKYGRRLVYIVVMALAALSAWWSAWMMQTWELYISNFLLGIAGAVNQTAIAMSIHDIFVHQRGTANGLFFVGLMSGTFLTPMAAGVQGSTSGWRVFNATLATAMSILTVIMIVALEETKFVAPAKPKQSLDELDQSSLYAVDSLARAKAGGLAPIVTRLDAAPPTAAPASVPETRQAKFPRNLRLKLVTRSDESLWKTFYYPIYSLWFPHVIFTSLQLGFSICWLVVQSTVIAIVFPKPPYNFDAAGLGYLSAGPFIGALFGAAYGGPLVDKTIVLLAKRNRGWFEPEMRIWLFPIPAIAMSAGLIIFGVATDRGAHFVIPSAAGALFAFAFGAISDISTALVLDSFPNTDGRYIVAQTFVSITFLRNAISMIGPFTVTPWLERMSLTKMFIVAASISMAINLLAVPLWIWGKRGRAAVATRYYRLSQPSG